MCGITVVLNGRKSLPGLRARALTGSKHQRHRGPDWSGKEEFHFACYNFVLYHERLAIVDPTGGSQPIKNSEKNLILSANGEIYNHSELRKQTSKYKYTTGSDCEVIIPLLEEFLESPCELKKVEEGINQLDGIFGFVAVNKKNGKFVIARDAIGVIPLYWGIGEDSSIWVSSEMKAIAKTVKQISDFPPGCYLTNNMDFSKLLYGKDVRFPRWYQPKWLMSPTPIGNKLDLNMLRELMEKAVVKRLMSDVPYGVLLSGGLDSSLVASIVSKHCAMRVESGETEPAWFPRLHTFSIGLKDSPDLKAAKLVADYLKTAHHEFVITVDNVIDTIDDAVWHLETYDVASIRSGIPMILLSRRIRSMGFKMVLNGDGSDEIFAGYYYNKWAPSPDDLHGECIRKVQGLSRYDCLRCNKSMMAWSVECRCPFLDKDLVQYVMELDPSVKMHFADENGNTNGSEKYILRKAFDKDYLPKEVLYRTKMQFSTGCGQNLNNSLKEYSEIKITDSEFSNRHILFPHNTPMTKEAFLYRKIFIRKFGSSSEPEKTITYEKSMNCSTKEAFHWIPKSELSDDPCSTKHYDS